MNEVATAVQQEKKVETEIEEFIITKGGTMIVGAELVGDKMTGLLCALLDRHKDYPPRLVMFRKDNYPEGNIGMAHEDVDAIVINLAKCMEDAKVIAAGGDVNLGLAGIIWVNVLVAIGHEISHIENAQMDRAIYEQAKREAPVELEESANNDAMADLVFLAKTYDIEIPADDLGYIGVELMDLFIGEDTKDLPWVIKAKDQLANGVVYEDGPKSCTTLREFIKMAYTNDEEAWEQEVTAVNLEGHLENGEQVHEVVDKPVSVEVQEPAVAGTAEVKVDEETPEPAITQDYLNKITAMLAGTGTQPVPPTPVNTNAPSTPKENANPFEVPLPNEVAGSTVTMGAAPTIATEMLPAFLKEVWLKLYHHMFVNCGWKKNPATNTFHFGNIPAIAHPVDLSEIVKRYGAEGVIVSYQSYTIENTQSATELPFNGAVTGLVFPKSGIVGYKLALNLGGNKVLRSFLTQNPYKKNANGALTQYAAQASQGHIIAWVFRDEAGAGSTFNEKCAVKIVDNVYETVQ